MLKKLYNEIERYEPIDNEEQQEKGIMLDFIKKNNDALSRNNKIAHFTTSAWIVNKNRNKVLMIYHKIYNSWAWVGGHADEDEDLFHVVKKEIEEETGISNITPLLEGIYGLNIVNVNKHIKRGNYVNDHLHLDIEYLFEADENEKIRIKEDENSGVAWIKIEEINDYVSEEKMKSVYAKLNKKLKKY